MSDTEIDVDLLYEEEWPTLLQASLQPSRGSRKQRLNTVAKVPKGWYVIIGRGTAAVVNHTTLRQTQKGKERLADPADKKGEIQLPVLHIGFRDPWATYHAHGMGQPPYLLTMPGFHNRPKHRGSESMIRTGMTSTSFAAITQQERDLLTDKYKTCSAWVAWIQERGEAVPQDVLRALTEEGLPKGTLEQKLKSEFKVEYPKYRLLVVQPGSEELKIRLIYAHKIDICVGAGRPNHQEELNRPEAKTQLWLPPELWTKEIKTRKVMTGPEALCETTPWEKGHRICVWGAGGIGLNMVERAEDVQCHLDWLPNMMAGSQPPGRYAAATTLHRTFNLYRNDTVLKHPLEDRAVKAGESGVRDATGATTNIGVVLTPCCDKWRFASHTDVKSVTDATGAQVKVKIEDYSGFKAVIRDYYAQEKPLDNGGYFPFSEDYTDKAEASKLNEQQFDRMFLCIGLVNLKALGTPDMIAKPYKFQKIEVDGRMVGLESEDKAIRIMGACAAMHPEFGARAKGMEATTKYFDSLPMSAVLPGFIFSGVNIATANGYFDVISNDNLNTMALKALETKLGNEVLARTIVVARRLANGFETIDELIEKLHDEPALKSIQNWEEKVRELKTDYREPEAFLT